MDFKEYQEQSRKTWIFDYNDDFIRAILGVCGESGELAEKVKKFLRGDYKNKLEFNLALMKEAGDVLYYIARVADYLKVSLETIAKYNIEKLKDRQKRNKIKGTGDNR